MFKKVLIAEDYEITNLSVQRVLQELNIHNVDHVYYCDDALAKIKKGIREKEPYDLLITDIYFEEDHYTQQIKDGKELIIQAKLEDPTLKIIVFSGENRSGAIDSLFSDYYIDGFVRKARYDGKELNLAINSVYQNRQHLSTELQQSVKKINAYELSNYDTDLIKLLAKGVLQKDIPEYLKNKNIKPNSLSSIEKRLSHIKMSLDVNSNEHLIAFCKDLGLI
ncbi:helix-turn-helix domain-containing protein [Chryseobacterium daecheongense]|uniref:DNA-binding NarL/FixJ family response regulator n=1 Tax=Chryseobacterium daecheongense TaxID=192389 RepID=A0A3N0VTJ6_9FLAO|nr:response regulator transcription factor [Chryseobacterium daecheongense]ROH96139.1 DNA-binding response regulator [Chryseobacterium daecheongense]TDX91446.1 DNA-binding NarL/FixJ family response regulator [Chryseobacterium daecheongense]